MSKKKDIVPATLLVEIGAVINNEENPRIIHDAKYKKLKQSITDFPEMLKLRPIVVDEDGVILGGNMRYQAMQELGHSHVHIIVANDLTAEQKKEFIIKDNLEYGKWDWTKLAVFSEDLLEKWDIKTPANFKVEEGKEKKQPELQFSNELLLQHNYVVVYFDNELDWKVAQQRLKLETVKTCIRTKGSQHIGIGRVLEGNKFLKLLK